MYYHFDQDYPNYELEKMIQNTTKAQQEIEPITENSQEKDILDLEILNSLATLKAGNKERLIKLIKSVVVCVP